MTVLQALDRYYDRMAARGEVVSPGYSTEPIGVVIVLAEDGAIVDVQVRRDRSGRKPKPERVPKWFGRSGTASTPFFLWDNTAYVLGISSKDPGKTERDHAAFKQLHLEQLGNEDDPGLAAVRRFLEHWSPDQYSPPLFDEKMLAWNVAFRLDGDTGPDNSPRLVHERPAAAAHVERLRTSTSSAQPVFCLVTGASLPPVRLHPKIKGVDGTAAAEVPLVSFNEDAFESYGQVQGANAPTSEAAAFRYGAALNRLLDRGISRNRIKIGDATVAFWADASAGEVAAEAAEDFFAALLTPPDDESEAAKVSDALKLVAKGRPVQEARPEIAPGVRFHVLGLAPNAARLSVRFWLEDTFERFAAQLARHHEDLALEPRPRGWTETKPPSVQRLLVRTTALQEKFENIPPLLAGEVMRAVLTGAPYPRTLLAAAIIRLRAGDDPGSGWHAAVIKACLNRFAKTEKEKMPVALESNREDTPYQLGRLFAVLESAQYAALGRVNATIGDRYYGAASSTPARVFGPLLRGLKNHISDARKRGQGGWIEPKVAEIMAKLPPELPRSLKLEEQGRFAIGYYHERGTRPAKADAADQTDQTGDQDQ